MNRSTKNYSNLWLICRVLLIMFAATFCRADDTPIPFWAQSDNISKLEYALEKKDTALVKSLLRSGVDPASYQKRFTTSIYPKSFPDRKFYEENLEIIKILLVYQTDVNFRLKPRNCPPLFHIFGIEGVGSNKLEAIKLMLDFAADIDIRDRCPSSLLSNALLSDEYEISKLLIERGHVPGDLEFRHLAAIRDPGALKHTLDAIKPTLLVKNAEVFFAWGIPLFIEYLINIGSLPKIIEVDYFKCSTPASYASKKRKARILLALKNHKVDIKEDDCAGKGAYDYLSDLYKYIT